MADYQKKIEKNEADIEGIKGKIEAAEAKYPAETRHPGVKEEIMRWSQDIKELKLENEIMEVKNEILEYKRVVPNFMTDAEAKAGL